MPTGFDLGSAFAKIELDASGIADGIASAKKSLSKGMADIGSSLTSIGGNMTLLGAPFLALGAAAVKSYSDSQKALAQLDSRLKSTAGAAGITRDAAIELASSLQKVTQFSDEDILSAENLMLTFTQIGKNVFPDAIEAATNMSVAFGQDLGSSVIQLSKALQDPVAGLTALKRVGVSFTDAQKKMIEQLVKAGKVEEAQKLILKELGVEFGGAAKAAGKTFAGQLEITKNKLDDMMETIGQRLLPIVQRFIDGISGLVDWFSNLDPHIQDIIVGVGALLASFAIIGPIIAGVGTVIGAVGGIIAGIGTVIGIILSPIGLLIAAGAAIVYLFRDQIGGALSVVWGFLQSGEGLFKALAAGIIALFGDNAITQAVSGVLLGIQDFFDHFQDRVKLYLSLFELYLNYYLINRLKDLWATVQPGLQKLADWFVNDGIPWIQRALLDIYNNVFQPVFKFLGGIWEIVQAGFKLFSDWFTAAGGLGGVKSAVNDFHNTVITPLIVTLQKIWTAIQPALTEFKNGMLAIIKPITDQVQALIDKFNTLVIVAKSINSGQFTPAQLIGAGATGTINGGYVAPPSSVGVHGSGVVPIPKVGGGSAAPRAGGGDVLAGMPYIVGEREPELFVPRQNGSILNGAQMAGMGGGFTWTGDLNINANDYAGGRSAARGALDEIEERWRSRGNG